jgi:hypothetical protein
MLGFDYTVLIKALYARKYYNRDPETLPHKNYVKGEDELKLEDADEIFQMVQDDSDIS